jgi:predicted nucleic acid-binding protein
VRCLLDTCVLSDVQRDGGDPGVKQAVRTLRAEDSFLSAVTIAELSRGIARMPSSRRKTELAKWYAALVAHYAERIIAFDTEIADMAGRLAADAERNGVTVPLADVVIGATAVRRGLVVVTRNERHFRALGVETMNPWSGQ